MLCLSREHDSLGGMAKSAIDLRDLTRVILGEKIGQSEDVDGSFRVGFVHAKKWQYPDWMCPLSDSVRDELVKRLAELADKLEDNGLFVKRGVDVSDEDIKFEGESPIRVVACKLVLTSVLMAQLIVAVSQFRENFETFTNYLDTPIKTLADLIAYNEEHADLAMPSRECYVIVLE